MSDKQKQWVVDGSQLTRATSVDELEISVRTYNALKNMDIKTVADMLTFSPSDFLGQKNFGRASLDEVKAILEPFGWPYMKGSSRSQVDRLNLEWPEDINLVDAFIIADKIHRLIEQNECAASNIGANYLSLVCVGYSPDDLRPDRGYSWVASFDCYATEPEWFETVDAYPYAAKGHSPEEVIRAAAIKVRDAFVKARKGID